jgi:hypothetical protein
MAAVILLAGWNVAETLSPPAIVLALVVAGLVVLAARRPVVHTTPDLPAGTPALRERAVLDVRLRDPDAPGRPRPRAPSVRTRAA